MLITSSFFLFYFFPIFIIFYLFIKKSIPFANLLIILASLYFYSTFGIYQLPILILPLLADYFIARFLHKEKENSKRKLVLTIGILGNILVLFYFKYYDFAVSSVFEFFPSVSHGMFMKNIVVPLGISFITFQRISYIVDVYKKNTIPTKNFIQYATYACLFPHLISGPIVRFSQIKNQLKKRKINSDTIFTASKLFVVGFAFKILIANQLFNLESSLLGDVNTIFHSLIIIFSFTLRIYFDFLGYTFMALGLAKFLGFDFPQNFNSPYQSKSITEFWRKWNITLSFWIRDYIYIPLGGSRKGNGRTYLNLLIAMLLAGLWHGASWNFVLWGLFHGAFLVGERYVSHRYTNIQLPGFIKIIYTFLVVSIGWILFRFTNMSQAMAVIKPVVSLKFGYMSEGTISLLLFSAPFILFAVIWSFKLREEYILKIKANAISSIFLILLFVISLSFSYIIKNSFFIYFQF